MFDSAITLEMFLFLSFECNAFISSEAVIEKDIFENFANLIDEIRIFTLPLQSLEHQWDIGLQE